MKQSDSLFYDVVNARGYAVQFKILGYRSALRYLDMYQGSFADRGQAPYKIRLTKPQPPTDRRTPDAATQEGEG